jgi:alpha-galactosidase
VARFANILGKYKQVRDDITRAFPVVSGPVGGTPEVHEKIAEKGRGVVVLFSSHGQYRYITENHPDRRVWHDDATAVTFDAAGHAVITANISQTNTSFPKAGASIVLFGVEEAGQNSDPLQTK